MPTEYNVQKKIVVKGSGRYDERMAAGTITPGHHIEINSDGKVLVNSSAGVGGERLFAVENALLGKTINDNYVSTTVIDGVVVGDRVRFVTLVSGDEVFAFIKAALAATSTITKGDFLTPNGDGTFKKATGSDELVLVADASIDLNDTGDVDTRIICRVV